MHTFEGFEDPHHHVDDAEREGHDRAQEVGEPVLEAQGNLQISEKIMNEIEKRVYITRVDLAEMGYKVC